MRDALVRLPDSALTRHYFEVPGDSLGSPASSNSHVRATAGRAIMGEAQRGRCQ
ncbi:MAG TPA: hypothetical protein VH478_20205 [Trebonia sp.]|nr:hypothetical protein [Trebonia sp.]